MSANLPRDTVGGELRMRCPWCGQDPGEAKVSIEDVFCAWEACELNYATRYDDGTAHGCALTAECPTCGKPFMVALQENGLVGRCARLLPVRTQADARLLDAVSPTPKTAGGAETSTGPAEVG